MNCDYRYIEAKEQFICECTGTATAFSGLRRVSISESHAVTYVSRSGVPIEIVSKVILRHSNLSTTERYLGKISDVEALKWIDTLYA